MSEFTLVIGNKNYSSWSLRGWLICKAAGIEFDEVLVRLYEPDTKAQIARYSPSGLLPVLVHGGLSIWDSLAIGEYLNELRPQAGLWPEAAAARAVARSVAQEMHAGFLDLRREMPMNIRASFPGHGHTPEVLGQAQRIAGMWLDCRKRFAGSAARDDGFLFGTFTVADAMFAPVATRFQTYGVKLDAQAQRYCEALLEHAAMKEWSDAARHEPWLVAEYEFR
ncbi:MAG: glutathione S-transferase family protein [Alphaproteobacteria bacterium]|nr:glutathione S-transferase family protein [Alphaproteobacteria bacterium]